MLGHMSAQDKMIIYVLTFPKNDLTLILIFVRACQNINSARKCQMSDCCFMNCNSNAGF